MNTHVQKCIYRLLNCNESCAMKLTADIIITDEVHVVIMWSYFKKRLLICHPTFL